MHSWYKLKELDCYCSFVLQSLFCFFPCFIDDWKCDQYRWINNKVAKLPSKNPFLRKTYFVSDSPKGPCLDFRKHAYELLPFNGLVLFHYLGDEKSYVPFSHRNKKKNKYQAFVRTCPSIVEKLKIDCQTATAKQVYRKSVMTDHALSYQPVFEPKNYQQVYRKLQEQSFKPTKDIA